MGQVVWSQSHSQQFYIWSTDSLSQSHMFGITSLGVNKDGQTPSLPLTTLCSPVCSHHCKAGYLHLSPSSIYFNNQPNHSTKAHAVFLEGIVCQLK